MKDKLEIYRKKRDFLKTTEPIGNSKKALNRSYQYSVQYHDARNLHFDLRLEYEGVLLSWAIPKGPSYNPNDKRLAVKVEDHPIDYLMFEGTIPEGNYGAGTVMVWDYGNFKASQNFRVGLKKGVLKFTLYGKRLKGKWTLIRIKDDNNWLLIKEKDKYCKKTSGITRHKTSIITKRTFKEIKSKQNEMKKIELKPAKLVKKIPIGNKWVYEIKYDGYRMLATCHNNKISLTTRNHHDYSKHFPDIVKNLSILSRDNSFILDGEIVVIDEYGRTNFNLLQNHLKTGEYTPSYVVFDLLYLNGQDLSKEPLIKRKKILKNLLKTAKNPIFYSQHISSTKIDSLINAVSKYHLEGIIAKNKNSTYSKERDDDWVKIKNRNIQEFLIGGYILSEKKKGDIKSLILGAYSDNKLYYVGLVGSGISHTLSVDFLKKFKKLERKTSPFANEVPYNSKNHYTRPTIIAQVEFSEWTENHLLRQPAFKGIRIDKNPKDVKLEMPNE